MILNNLIKLPILKRVDTILNIKFIENKNGRKKKFLTTKNFKKKELKTRYKLLRKPINAIFLIWYLNRYMFRIVNLGNATEIKSIFDVFWHIFQYPRNNE